MSDSPKLTKFIEEDYHPSYQELIEKLTSKVNSLESTLEFVLNRLRTIQEKMEISQEDIEQNKKDVASVESILGNMFDQIANKL